MKAIVESGLIGKIDPTDPYILEFLKSFSQSDGIRKITLNNDSYYWFNYKHILNQIPIIKIKKDAVYRRFKRYEELGLIKAHPDNKKSGTAYYCLLPLFDKVTSKFEQDESKGVGAKTEGSAQKPKGYGAKTGGGTVSKPDYNTIKDNTINNKKEKKPINNGSLLKDQFRAVALNFEFKRGYNLSEWLDYRFPTGKLLKTNKKWLSEWLDYFVEGCIARGHNPTSFKPEAYEDSIEKFFCEKLQAKRKEEMYY